MRAVDPLRRDRSVASVAGRHTLPESLPPAVPATAPGDVRTLAGGLRDAWPRRVDLSANMRTWSPACFAALAGFYTVAKRTGRLPRTWGECGGLAPQPW